MYILIRIRRNEKKRYSTYIFSNFSPNSLPPRILRCNYSSQKKKKKLGKPLYDILRYFYRISIYTYNRQVEIMVVDIL